MSGQDSFEVVKKDLLAIVGPKRASTRDSDLRTYSRDMWPRLLLAIRTGAELPHRPNIVVWPEDVQEIVAIVRLARQHKIPIVPYGGGSGVCGGVVPTRGGITVDTKRMTEILSISPDELTCEVEAGINGERFERELNRKGFTLGHFPSSIYCSTVGGWLACRAAGQMSTKYGKIEDRVIGVTAVTGRGEIIRTDTTARSGVGPNWTQILTGSEGTLGLITSARFRINPVPEVRIMRGFEFESVEQGLNAIRAVLQKGLRPAVVRLYDEVDTFINHVAVFKKHKPEEHGKAAVQTELPSKGRVGALVRAVKSRVKVAQKSAKKQVLASILDHADLTNQVANFLADKVAHKGCRMIVGLEGSRIRTDIEARLTFEEFIRCGGVDQGEEPGLEWLEHRYSVSYRMSPTFRDGLFVDTMEVASTWTNLLGLYRAVKNALSPHGLVMAHFSHAYSEGCSIYFTFVSHSPSQTGAEQIYDALWRDGLTAASRAGGTISHHHGIGLLKSNFVVDEYGEAMSLLRAVKSAMDPDHIFNPDKLGLGDLS